MDKVTEITPEDYRILALNSINYVEKFLKRFRRHLHKQSKEKFTEIEVNDLMDILGFEEYELKQLLEQDF